MTFYLDTSALLKRYIVEPGSQWITTLYPPSATNLLATALITKAEAAAALAARYRRGGFAVEDLHRIEQDILQDFEYTYSIIEITEPLVDLATALAKRQKLRGYDAVQLAAGLTLNHLLVQAGLPSVTFVSADVNLLQAAQNEGLKTENPNVYE